MYLPKIFNDSSHEEILKVFKAYPFAILATSEQDNLEISHLPFIYDEKSNILITHLANNNSHIKNINNKKCTVIFNGPDLYISPDWYVENNLVPTWNYISVHVKGTIKVISDDVEIKKILDLTTKFFEEQNNTNWMNNLDEEFDAKLRTMITVIEIKIDKIDAKFKLSQNRTEKSKLKMIKKMKKDNSKNSLMMIEFMKNRV